MKKRSFLSGLAALAVAAVAVQAATTPRDDGVPSLDRIKALAGEWVQVDEDGEPTDHVISRIRVTAGGSAVLELLFPGTAKEMVTVYHMDGDDLVLTHYCVKGNAPHMKARRDTEEGVLLFECQGGANIESTDDGHMHEGRIEVLGEGRMRTAWRLFEGGENTYTAGFDLVRKSDE